MKKWVIFGDKTFEVDLKDKKMSFVDLGNGVKMALIDKKPVLFKIRISGENFEVETQNAYAELRVLKYLPSDLSRGISPTTQQIKSPMPALVVEVNKKPGENVREGETVITIEAMKMRTQLKARISGVVKHVYVSEGVNVGKGQTLAVIERG